MGSVPSKARLGRWATVALLFALALPGGASAHPGHDHGPAGLDGRIPGQPDFVRKGKTTYEFLPSREEYEVRTQGKPTSFIHFDAPATEGVPAGPNTPLPTNEDAPICATSGNRIVPVYTHRPGSGGPTPTAQIQSIIQRMNWKIIDQSSQASGGARTVQLVVDCTAGGVINVYDVATADESYNTIWGTVPGQLFGKPEGPNSVKYLAFDPGGVGGGVGSPPVSPIKKFNNWSATQSGIGIAYNGVWETHVPVHELFHTMGASQGGSSEPPPFGSKGAHCYDGLDILCYEDGSGPVGAFTTTRCPFSEGYDQANKTPVDCGKDTYFDTIPEVGSWLATHWNSGGEENPFLVNSSDRRVQVETGTLVAVNTTEATVSGNVAANGSLATKYRFDYGLTTSYGSSAPASFTSVTTDMYGKDVKQPLTGLSAGVEYHYRLAAQNSNGTVYGADRTFVTSRWQLREMPSFEKSVDLEDVSCLNKNACMAVGVHAKSPEVTVALRGENGVWTPQATQNPSESTAKLTGVSCPTASSCAAVGSYFKLGTKPLAERWNGSTWTLDTPPIPGGSSSAELMSVSCVSSSYCVAVGLSGPSTESKTLVEAWNGSEWSVVTSPSPGSDSELKSVSCVTTSSCVAVGSADNNSVLVERWNGSSWSVEATPVPNAESTHLKDVSCTSTTACMSIGSSKNVYLAISWDGSKWTESKPSETVGSFGGVSCATSNACYASGTKGTQFWDGSKWIFDPTASTGESVPLFRDLSCWSATSCVGVGTLFDAGQNKRLPIVEQRSAHVPPVATTGAATGLALEGTLNAKATLSGKVGLADSDPSYYFEYGTTTSYGSKVPAVAKEIATSEAEVEVSEAIEFLSPNTTYHYRLVAFNEAGISKGEDRVFTTLDTMPIKALSFGSTGAGPGQLSFPRGIAVEPDGEVWIADDSNNRIQKFNESGEYLTQFGSAGEGNGQFDTPVDIAITAGGDLWVTDALNCRVQKFDSTGKYLDQFGGCGFEGGKFVEASGIAIGPNGHIWVTDSGYYRVQEFTAAGEFIRSVGGYGIGNGQFESPNGVAIGSDGHVWVADSYLNRVQEFSASGEYLSQFGTYGTGPGQFAGAGPIEVTPSGRIWITDRETGRVQGFNASGHYLGTFGSFWEPGGLAAGPEDSVYVSDSRNDRVQKWRLAKPPYISPLSAQNVTHNQATLRGQVNARGFLTNYRFEYGTTTSYGTSVPIPDKSVGASVNAVELSEAIGSLAPATVYHYRIRAQSDGGPGPVYGEDRTFETLPAPIEPPQLEAMATTKAFDGSSASLADFSANWSTPSWASGSTPKGQDTSTGWGPVDAYPTVNATYFKPTITDGGGGIATVATLAARPSTTNHYFSLWLDLYGPSFFARTGYELRFTETGANVYEVALNKWSNGTKTSLGTKTGYSFPVGSKLALIDKGATVSTWAKTGAEFTKLLSAEDTAYSAGNAGVEGAGNNLRLTNFKTGSLLDGVANMDAALKGLPMIDTFNRSESPLSNGGAWAALAWNTGTSGKTTGQTIGGFGWYAYDAQPKINGAYSTKATMADTGAGVGVAATLSWGSFAAGSYYSLWLDMPSPGSARTGYELRFAGTSSGVYDVTLSKWQAGTQTVLGTKTGYSFANGNQFALVDKGGTVSVWTKTGSEFTQILSAEDASFISGFAGIEASGPNSLIRDFRSGSLAPS
jgi:sugar lactone lactonase YvrE